MLTYQLNFNKDPLPGFTQEQLESNLQRVLKLSEVQTKALFQRPTTILKKKLTQAKAEEYKLKLAGFGISVSIEAELSLAPIEQEQQTIPETKTNNTEQPTQRADFNRNAAFINHPATTSASVNEKNTERIIPVQFTGTGDEYFGIWIINIVLTLVTFGVYSAWAKVRNKQYFYGHTLIDNGSFQYLAKPTAILKGRIIAFFAFVIWYIVSQTSFYGSIALLLISAPIVPWVLARSLRFNAINSTYRAVRFNFTGTYWQAAQVLYLWPVVSLVTFSLGLPQSLFKKHEFNINNSRYGTAAFSFTAKIQDYYIFGLKMLGAAMLIAMSIYLFHAIAILFFFLGYILMLGLYKATLLNLYMSNIRLGNHRIICNMDMRTTLWIYFTNSLFIGLTLGLYVPWAKVRMASYRATCTRVSIKGDLDKFIAYEAEQLSALSHEMGEMFDMDIAII